MSEVEVTLREAIPEDAAQLLALSQQVSRETDFLLMDENGMGLPVDLLAQELGAIYDSPNNFLVVAFVGEILAGAASIRAGVEPRIEHIGEVGIFIAKEYWGFGLGTLMMEEVLWLAKESQQLARLELTVQERNTAAIHLYEKIGFYTEAQMKRGAKSETGEYIDTRLMSLLIN